MKCKLSFLACFIAENFKDNTFFAIEPEKFQKILNLSTECYTWKNEKLLISIIDLLMWTTNNILNSISVFKNHPYGNLFVNKKVLTHFHSKRTECELYDDVNTI